MKRRENEPRPTLSQLVPFPVVLRHDWGTVTLFEQIFARSMIAFDWIAPSAHANTIMF